MARQDPDNRLSEARQREWNSRAHLHSNRMGWNYYVEALISLANARFYLAESGKSGAALAAFVAPIDERIEQLINEIVAGPAEPTGRYRGAEPNRARWARSSLWARCSSRARAAISGSRLRSSSTSSWCASRRRSCSVGSGSSRPKPIRT